MSASRSRSLKVCSNDWESLCPELFEHVLKAVQQNAGQDAGEARRVVALAGVCRRWRHLVQQSYTSPLAEIGLLQFPFALRQPGPSNRPVQCLLKRHRSCFILFQDNGGRGEKLDFLMAARRIFKPYGHSHIISASNTSFSTRGHAYMGKLKSDFWASEFCLWEVSGNEVKSKRLATRVNFFDRVAGGFRQRAMSCELFPFNKNLHSARTPVKENSPHEISQYCDRKVLRSWSCFSPAVPKTTPARSSFLRSYSSLRRSGALLDVNNPKAPHSKACTRSRELIFMKSMMLESKTPEWDDERQCWSLNFHGRSTLPSSRSFQLVQSNIQGGQGGGQALLSSDATEAASEEEAIFLQLGKVGKGLYTVDFCHPLSAFQAFAICLSSFATKVGLEP